MSSALAAPRPLSREDDRARWHRRVVRREDLTGALVLVTPVLLSASLSTQISALAFGMYGLYLAAALSYLVPFAASLRRNPANVLLVSLFGVLAMSTCAAFARVSWSEAMLQAKSLAATAVWASIYVVAFSSVVTAGGVFRLTRWIGVTCAFIAASVYVSALLYAVGIPFGEVLVFENGGIRAFGPLGDQVSFVLVLPALTSLVAASPAMFGVYLGALLLTATRGAVLCLVVGVIAYFLAVATGRIRPDRRRLRWTVLAMLVGAAVWLTPLSATLMGRVWEQPGDSGYSLRLAAITTGAGVFRDNPVLGLGFNGFEAARPALYEDWLNPLSAENGLSRTSNQYVQTATDGGALALLLLVLFVISIGRNALRVAGWREATPELIASQLWLISMIVGNQGALWLLSHTTSGFFIFAVAGLGARASAMSREEAALLQSARGNSR
jgi:O-antigen ligase/polysaccharide polymerase Wzy-like membrane protein